MHPSMKQTVKRLHAAIQAVRGKTLCLRAASRHFKVPYSTIRDNLKVQNGTVRNGRGRPPCLNTGEERLIADAILECADRGFPMRKGDIQDMVHVFVGRLPFSRRSRLPFKHGRPGSDFITGFLRRHPEIRMRRRAALEQQRKLAMNPRTLAMHYARLKQAYVKYKIVSPAQVFNIDESGVSGRTGGRGKGKAAMRASGRSNSVELEFAGNAEHLTIMPVVSADGKPWPPVVIMPGVLHKFRHRPDGKKETLHDYLPKDTYLVHRTPASMTKEFFLQWVEIFIKQTAVLRKEHKYILLTMDAFGAHLSYRALLRLAENTIIAYALPAHK